MNNGQQTTRFLVIRDEEGICEVFVADAHDDEGAKDKVAALGADRSKLVAFPFNRLHDGWSY